MATKSPDAPSTQRQKFSGAELLLKCLQEESVKCLWIYPGNTIMCVYDVLAQQKQIDGVTVRHEQAAVHTADGYARASGEIGVVLIPSGAGVTAATTGIAAAYMDSVPLVIISGQVRNMYAGQDAYQECDTMGITRPIVKHNILVNDVADLALAIKKAFYIAGTGRRGPVLVDVTENVWHEMTAFSYPEKLEMRSYNPVVRGHTGQIKKALHLLLAAQRPCIYVGGGVVTAGADKALASLLELLDMPVISTMMGIGGISGTDPRFLGMSGMHGTFEANRVMHDCDVLLALGARFGDRAVANTQSYMQDAARKIIHIDIDPSSISKRIKADIPIVGDLREVLDEILLILKEDNHQANTKKLAPWWKQINQWRRDDCLAYDRHETSFIKPQKVVETLWKMTYKDDVYIASDVGQHQMWLAQYYRFERPRRWITSGGLGATGLALPLALGVKKAFPKAEVFCVNSEASIQKNIQELATSKHYKLPIIILALNNCHSGASRSWGMLDNESSCLHPCKDAVPDFVKLAQAYGHVGMMVDAPGDVEAAIKEARQVKDTSVFLDIRIDPRECVYPVVPDNKGLAEMILRPQEKK
ncbi:MAG: biosynthetic-type acetolactate synthase large subunit [Saezia sp.]